jgi:type II secretory pathway pseudopilin PulG
MKKTIFIALLAIFSLSAAPTFATTSATTATATTTDTNTKLSDEQISNYRSRVEEIRDMDKSELTSSEKMELKTELKDIKATMHRDGTFIYIGGSTLVIILILLLIL